MEQTNRIVVPIGKPGYKISPDEVIKFMKELPPFPRVAMKALDILSQPDFDMKELASIVNLDQGITANVLRVCNSPYYSFVRRISSVSQAIAYLGTAQLKEIVLASGLKKVFLKRNLSASQYRFYLWQHSLYCAIMSQVITKKLRPRTDFTIYTAALLHDVGRLLLDEYDPTLLGAIIEFSITNEKSILETERIILGVNHSELGARLVDEWSFPDEIMQGIKYHHDPLASSEPEITLTISLANVLSHYIDPLVPQSTGNSTPLEEAAARLGFNKRGLEELFAEFFKQYERVEALMRE